jgi:hypothetical protein
MSMAVSVKMNRSVTMTMGVEMHAVTPQPPKYVRAKAYHHDANRALEGLGDVVWNCVPQENGGAGEQRERDGMAQPPCQPMPDDVSNIGSAGCNAGDGCDMISFQCVLHPQHET